MTGDGETRPPVTGLISQAQTARAQSAAARSRSAEVRSRSETLRSRSAAEMSRSQVLRSQWVAMMPQSQALRSRPVRKTWAARRDQPGGRVFASPAAVRAQLTLTYRELAAAIRRRAITRARELGLLNG